MLQFSVFNDTDWLYPDSEHNTHTEIALQLPRGGHVLNIADAVAAGGGFMWRSRTCALKTVS